MAIGSCAVCHQCAQWPVAANGGIVNQGTVVRLNLAVSEKQMPVLESVTIVGTGFAERSDPAALVIGPTGLALSPSCKQSGNNCWTPFGEDEPVLYLADSLNNRIAVITDPLTRMSFHARAKRQFRTSFRPSTSNWYFLNRIPITSWCCAPLFEHAPEASRIIVLHADSQIAR